MASAAGGGCAAGRCAASRRAAAADGGDAERRRARGGASSGVASLISGAMRTRCDGLDRATGGICRCTSPATAADHARAPARAPARAAASAGSEAARAQARSRARRGATAAARTRASAAGRVKSEEESPRAPGKRRSCDQKAGPRVRRCCERLPRRDSRITRRALLLAPAHVGKSSAHEASLPSRSMPPIEPWAASPTSE